MDKTDKNAYELPAAATILGISLAKLMQMINRGEVEVKEENGTQMISKQTIAKLFDKVSNTQDDPEAAEIKENVPAEKKTKKKKTSPALPKGAILIEEDPILDMDSEEEKRRKTVENEAKRNILKLYRDHETIHQRIGSILEHIEKLNYKVQYLRKIEDGRIAEFWQEIGSLYKQVNHKSSFQVAEAGSKLYIFQTNGEDSSESAEDLVNKLISRIKNAGIPSQIKDAMIAAIQQGQLPPPRIIKELGLNPNDYKNLRQSDEEEEE